jgi:hypothetical protein
MKRNPRDGTNGEQSNEQQAGGQQSNGAAPEPASKRDAQEAERKAEEAKAKAVEEAERVHQNLRSEISDLRERVAVLDQLVNNLYQSAQCREEDRRFNEDMSHVMPENKEDGGDESAAFLEGSSDA